MKKRIIVKVEDGEWFKIAGRGNVYACTLPQDIWTKLLKKVIIEDVEYEVKGIEYFAKWHNSCPVKGTNLKKNERIGLLVDVAGKVTP